VRQKARVHLCKTLQRWRRDSKDGGDSSQLMALQIPSILGLHHGPGRRFQGRPEVSLRHQNEACSTLSSSKVRSRRLSVCCETCTIECLPIVAGSLARTATRSAICTSRSMSRKRLRELSETSRQLEYTGEHVRSSATLTVGKVYASAPFASVREKTEVRNDFVRTNYQVV
jgi:hypothetical protein